MTEANTNKSHNKSSVIKHTGMSFDFCSDTSKECLKRNKFYNEIRKNLMRKKLEKYIKNKSIKNITNN
ncbi:MAG: hypothetical protein ACFFA7_11280 [Promethearchaeota archaeon]